MATFSILIPLIFIILFLMGGIVLLQVITKKATSGKALIRTGYGGMKVSLTQMAVLPLLHEVEIMDLTYKTIVISRKGSHGLLTKDNQRADVDATFYVRVNPQQDDIMAVAQSIGSANVSQPEYLHRFFEPKFTEAMKKVFFEYPYSDIAGSLDEIRDNIFDAISLDLNGFSLDDLAIDFQEDLQRISQ